MSSAWSCGVCTYTHSTATDIKSAVCVMCQAKKPAAPITNSSSEIRKSRKHKLDQSPEIHDDSSVQEPIKLPSVPEPIKIPVKDIPPLPLAKTTSTSSNQLLAPSPITRSTSGNVGDEWGDDDSKEQGGWGDADTADTSGGGWGSGVPVDHDEHQVLEEMIPAEVKQRVQEDVNEVKLISRYVAAPVNFGGGTQITIRLGLPVKFLGLNKEQALAWGISQSKTIFVELQFPPHYFNITKTTEVKIKTGLAATATSPLESCGFTWSLTKAIRKDCLGLLTNRIAAREYKIKDIEQIAEIAHCSYLVAIAAYREAKPHTIDAAVSLLSDKAKRKAWDVKYHEEKSDEKKTQPVIHPDVMQIVDICMGVTTELAELALKVEGRVDDAIELLTHEATREELETHLRSLSVKQQTVGTHVQQRDQRIINELSGHNYLVKIISFLESWVRRCNNYCTICGGQLKYVGIKPAICGEALCKMGQEEMGLGLDIATEVKERPEVLDLLLTLLIAGAQGNLIVTPAHVNVLYKGTQHKLCNDKGELDKERLSTALNLIPSVGDMALAAARGNLNDYLDKIDPLIAPIIRWTVGSNRAHLRKLDNSEKIKDVTTAHQFVLLSTSPELEVRWQAEKRTVEDTGEKGAILTWHGSSTGNWHSILRIGLKNMSNTSFMSSGAAYGQGIYMAKDSATSIGYCKVANGWSKSMFGAAVHMMALCEVVNNPGLKPPAPFYVVPQEEWVATRYLFVFSGAFGQKGTIEAESLRTSLPKFELPKDALIAMSDDGEAVDEETRNAVANLRSTVQKLGTAARGSVKGFKKKPVKK